METIRLGRTNAEVSVAGLGCGGASRLGMKHGASTDQAADLVRRALDLGISFVDTAQAYGTEEAVGRGVAGRRDEVFISTKTFAKRPDGQLLSPPELIESIELSLRRLGTDRIDLFNLHGVLASDYPGCLEVLVPVLRRQREAGKIRFLGVTEYFITDTGHAMLARALPDAAFDVVMVGFNLLNPSARRRIIPLAQAGDVGTLIMFAVRRALSDSSALREAVERLVAEGEVAAVAVNAEDPLDFVRQHPGVRSVVEAAYRFCRHEPGVHVVLTGTGKAEHLEENIRSILAPPLPPELLSRLEAVFGRVESLSGN